MGLRVNGSELPSPVAALEARVEDLEEAGTAPTPTGTGYPHVTAGVQDAAAQGAPTVRATLDATRRTTYTTAGWTLEDGSAGGSIAVAGSVVRATIPAGVTCGYGLGTYTAPRARVALASPWAVSIRLRIAGQTNNTSDTRIVLALEREVGGVRDRVEGLRIYLSATEAGSLSTGVAWGTSLRAVPRDGTGWLWLVSTPTGWATFYAASANPAEGDWVYLGGQTVYAGLSVEAGAYTHLAVAVEQSGASASTVTVDLGQVLVDDLREVAP